MKSSTNRRIFSSVNSIKDKLSPKRTSWNRKSSMASNLSCKSSPVSSGKSDTDELSDLHPVTTSVANGYGPDSSSRLRVGSLGSVYGNIKTTKLFDFFITTPKNYMDVGVPRLGPESGYPELYAYADKLLEVVYYVAVGLVLLNLTRFYKESI